MASSPEGAEAEAAPPEAAEAKEKRKRRGVQGRLWRPLFGGREDFEKLLQYLPKEEATVRARMLRRAQFSRRAVWNLIMLSVLAEVLAVVYAIMMTRDEDLTWQMRAMRVLPMFILPAVSSVIYSTVVNFTRMLDRKDQKTLEKLRAERKAKIDELKERTNYYLTQQLIQKYDLDPAAKAAAASVLASKLGEETGLKVHVGEEPKLDAAMARSNDAEIVPSDGLRNRKQPNARGSRPGAYTPAQGTEPSLPASAGLETAPAPMMTAPGAPFLCNGCKEPGYGPRSEHDFSGGCHSSVLHTRCARADDPLSGLHTLVHPLFGYGKQFEFHFLHEPPHPVQGRLCDACGEPTRGFVYHCSGQDVDLHPCCACLPDRIIQDGRAFDLHRRASRPCALCPDDEGQRRWFWAYRCYMDDDEAVELHVACLKEMARRSWEACYRNQDDVGDGALNVDSMLEKRFSSTFGDIAGTVASFITALVFGSSIVKM